MYMRGATYNEQLQHLAEEYRSAGEPWPATLRQVAAWAIENKLWKPQRSTLVARLAEDLSRALREEYITDPQGRSVRAKHAARMKSTDGEQLVFWDDIRTASREHMQMALQQRRQQIVGDCRQLKTDADSYNENANTSTPIQLIFDFTDDLAELEAMEALKV